MFSRSPFNMMMHEPSSYYGQHPIYVQSPYQRSAHPLARSVSPQLDVIDDAAEDDLAEYVARVHEAEHTLADAERDLAHRKQQLAQAKKQVYLRALERERKQREAQQVAYYQAVQAERQRRQQLYEKQMKLREEQLQRHYEEQQRQLEKQQVHRQQEDEVKRDMLNQLLGEIFGQQLSRQLSRQTEANKQSTKSAVNEQSVKSAVPSSQQAKQPQPSAMKPFKEASTSSTKVESPTNSSFFIPVRVINSCESSDEQVDKLSSSTSSRVSVPLTVNTAPASPVEIEDEPITPKQWNLDASDVFKADRVLTPAPSEPASPKKASFTTAEATEASVNASVAA